jgi:hypothetical protein
MVAVMDEPETKGPLSPGERDRVRGEEAAVAHEFHG